MIDLPTVPGVLLALATLVSPQPQSAQPSGQSAGAVTAPRILREVKPEYTAAALRAKIQGVVTMECVVELDGTVGAVRIVRSLDSVYGLDDEAIRAVRQWRFAPGTKDGTPVRVAISIEMSFALGDRAGNPTANTPDSLAPASWPELFIDRSAPTGTPAPDWLEDSVQTPSFYAHFAYPPSWKILKSMGNQPLVTLHADDGLGNRTISISEDARPAPVLFDTPVTQARLDEFAAGLKERSGNRGIQQIGSGQMTRPGGLWVWFEMAAATISAPNAPPAVAEYFRTSNGGIHLWSFTTTVNGRLVDVFCSVLHRANATASDKEQDIRRAGLEFGAIMRRLTIQPR